MDCSRFERRLAELFGEELSESERLGFIADLRSHAWSCLRCGQSSDLLDLLALPPGERDLAEEPPERYWDKLQAAVVRRVSLSERENQRSRRLGWVAAAAAILLAVAGFWSLRGPVSEHGVVSSGTTRSAEADAVPAKLDVLLQDAGPEAVRAGLDFLVGLPGVTGPAVEVGVAEFGWVPGRGGDDGIVPLIEDIDVEDRDALLDWLNEREPVDREVES